jgi:hypothetical protein
VGEWEEASSSMSSPETKKKRQALPSVLSNIRNAQAAIGRATTTAADEPHHEWEMREREGNNIISSPLMQPPVDRRNQTTSSSYSSSSYATTLNNFSQRFGNAYHTQKRRLRRKDSSGVPSSFYFAVGCFFFAFPIIFILYILARHSVFGDEGYGSGTVVQKQQHEISSAIVVNPDDEIRGKNFGVNFGKVVDLHVREEDVSVDPTSNDGVAQSYGDLADPKESHIDPFIPSKKVDIATNDDETGHHVIGIVVDKAEKSLLPSSDGKEDTDDKRKKSSEGKLLRGSHPKATVNEQQTFSADILTEGGDRRRILRDFAVAVAAVAV